MIAQLHLNPGNFTSSQAWQVHSPHFLENRSKDLPDPGDPKSRKVFKVSILFPTDYVTPQILTCLNPAVWLSHVWNPGSEKTVSGFLSEFCLQTVATQTGSVSCPNGVQAINPTATRR